MASHPWTQMEELMGALTTDHALFFELDGTPVREKGWAWPYADVLIAFMVDEEDVRSLQLHRRRGTPIDPQDLKDLWIIARKVGVRLDTDDSMIIFTEV